MTDTTTARRKAMAEAIRAKYVEQLNRGTYDSGSCWDELATAADEAREQFEKEQAK